MTEKRRAVYAGSFDPPTNGHLWTITQAARIFDEVVVAVAVNPDKKSTFSVDDRVKMLRDISAAHENVSVESFGDLYTVEYTASIGASFLVRGQRNTHDFVSEFGMRQINADIDEGITTVFLIPPRELAEISSSLIKGLIGPKGWERLVSSYVPPVVLRQLIGLKHQVWENLNAWQGRLNKNDDKYAFWDNALKPYMSEDRHYHDWLHIVEMLNLFKEMRTGIGVSHAAIEMAILFHDYVYNVLSKTNEADSAQIMREIMGKQWDDGTFEDRPGKVASLIMATRHDPKFVPLTYEERVIIDLDLAILGADPKRFDEYEAGIRAEYAHFSDHNYAIGRSQILQGFLDRGRIFYTDYLHEKLGARAVENLKRSIAKLSSVQ